MSKSGTNPIRREETPVDDVRRVRRRFSQETGGDIRKEIEEARRTTEELKGQLGLKPAGTVEPPTS